MQNSKTKYKDDELMSFQATTAPYKVADNPIQITTVSSSVRVPLQVKTELSSLLKTVLSIYPKVGKRWLQHQDPLQI